MGLILGASAQAQTTVGRTPGAASVSNTGAARYLIPVWTPPGTNGLAPALAIAYDHRSGNGLLGAGFRLQGFSSIRRCAPTLAQDGMLSPVGLDATDRYCLDGQRLRLTAGTHGVAGAQYQTEVESFARVTANGAAGGGPAWFQVERRDGLIYQYGATPDSRIESTGSSTPREWALNRIRDRNGNYVDFVYVEDASTGTYRPLRIDYTGHLSAGTAPYYSVRFGYETRSAGDLSGGYLAGGLMLQGQRLTRIDVQHVGGTPLRSYQFYYDSSPTTGRSRLVRVQECAGGSCLAPTTIAWSTASAGWSAESPLPIDATALASAQAGDANGDGFEDLYYFDSGARAWAVLHGSASGLSATPYVTGLGADSVPAQALAGDLDGNGRRDVLVPGAGGAWYWLRHDGTGSYLYTSTGIANVAAAGATTLIDVDGDALDDLVYTRDSTSLRWRRNASVPGTISFATESLLWNAPSGTRIASQPLSTASQRQRSTQRVADFNGDGRADVLLKLAVDGGVERWQLLASRGSTYIAQYQIDGVPDPLLGDFNGDGLTDVAWMAGGSTWQAAFGTGRRGAVLAGMALAGGSSIPGASAVGQALVVDWDGDGRSDLLVPGSGEWLACRSLGLAFEACRLTGMASSGLTAPGAVLDANGDGLGDLVQSSSAVRQRTHLATVPDLLVSVTDGYGQRAQYAYAPLTSGTVHAPARGSVFPVTDAVTPDYVVAQLSQSDGVGGDAVSTYRYEGALAHQQGRGFLGFARRSVTDGPTGAVTTEDYRQEPQAFHLLGALASRTVRQSSGATMHRTTYGWDQLLLAAGAESRAYPYLATTSDDSYELDGTLVANSTVRTTVDEYGGVLSRTTVTTEMNGGISPGATYTERVTASYVTNDVANWCLGRPAQIDVVRYHSLPGGGVQTRTSAQTVDPVLCRVVQWHEEPASADQRITTSLAYDAWGNVVTRTQTAPGQATRVTSLAWSSGRYPQSVTNAEGHRTTFGWDATSGLPLVATDPNGLSTQRQYDAFGRLLREIRPDGTSTSIARSPCGSSCLAPAAVAVETTTELGVGGTPIRSATVATDLLEREVYQVSEQPGGSVWALTRYSPLGPVAQRSVPAWCCDTPVAWVSYGYDVFGRVSRIERPASAVDPTPLVLRWQRAGLAETETDSLGRTEVTRRDALGRIVQSIDAGNADTDFEYDASGNLVRVRDFRGNETVMSYDLRGRRSSLSDVDSGLRTYRYSPYGDLLAETNARGQSVTHAYDRLSRLVSRQEPEGTTTWTWGTSAATHDIGRLARVSGPGFLESYEYDAVGRPVARSAQIFGSTFVTRFGYDPVTGLSDLVTYPAPGSAAPLRVRQQYERGRLVRLTDADAAGLTFWQLGSLDALGQVADEMLGNGVRVASARDAVTGALLARASGPGGGNAYQDLRYEWNAAGNLASRQEGNLGVYESFGYDSRDRLDFMRSSTGAVVDLDYDELGNLTYKSDVGAYTYDASRRHAVVAAGGNSYAYDANGDVVNASGTSIRWTSYDLPTQIVHPSGNYSLFDYGPDRSRIRQVARSAGQIAETIYVPGGLYEKVNRNGAVSERHYILADGRRVAVQTRTGGGTPSTVFLLEDHLGGVDGFTSSSGALLGRTSTQPFGARRSGDWKGASPTSSEWSLLQSTTPRGFNDQEHVDNLGLIHMNGRVYDPVLARFLSPDPVVQAPFDAQSWNRYAYVRNNPLRYTDPTGFLCFDGHSPASIFQEPCLRNLAEQVIVQASRFADRTNVFFGGTRLIQPVTSSQGEAGTSVDVEGDTAGPKVPVTPEGPETAAVVTAPPANDDPLPMPIDASLSVAADLASLDVFSDLMRTTTELGDSAAQHYADLQVQTGNPLYAIPGVLSSLWTPDTAPETVIVLGVGSALGRWAARPFWQYVPEGNPAYSSTWLTRGRGWKPPYEPGTNAASNLSLPPYNPGTAVRPVTPPWNQYVRGPRVVNPEPGFGPGATGGGLEYRVIPFEK